MFEEMVGDDEILTVRFERGQFFSIIDDAHLYERQSVQFRIMTTQVIFIQTINVGHAASWWNPEWIMQAADLDPATTYEPLCQRLSWISVWKCFSQQKIIAEQTQQ